MKKKIRSSTLRNIKKAESAGVEVDILYSLEGIRDFYRLNSLTRRDHGLPPQPWKFFENIQKRVLGQGKGFLSLGRLRGQAIAGAIFFCFGETAVFKYGASDKNYQHVRPNNLVMWEAIRRCQEEGFQRLCLGRTDLDHQGLKQFKDGWGAEQTQIYYLRYHFTSRAFQGPVQKISKQSEKLLRRLPLPVLETLGKLLYRHAG